MKSCVVSAECVLPGSGPLKLRRTTGKRRFVYVDLVALHASSQAGGPALRVLRRPGAATSSSTDPRVCQASRSQLARQQETLRKKQQQLKREHDIVAPVVKVVMDRAREASALRAELSKVTQENAAMQLRLAGADQDHAAVAQANWQDGVQCGQRGWGFVPTPSSRARAGRVAPA